MQQHLTKGRMDRCSGAATRPGHPWFGQDIRQSLPLALENYDLLHRLWREDIVDWQGKRRTPLQGFTSIRGPWTSAAVRVARLILTPEIAEQAAYYGDGYSANDIFGRRWPTCASSGSTGSVTRTTASAASRGHRRARWSGLHREELAGRQAGIPALLERSVVYGHGPSLEEFGDLTPLSVGSPQEVIDKTLTFREHFGDYQRQLFLMATRLPLKTVLDQLDLLGQEVVPVLRQEIAARQDPETPEAPTHASLVRAKYGDQPARQPRPNANRGDNTAGSSPYQDPSLREPREPRQRRAVTNLANDAWEALLSAHAALMKQFAAGDIWADLSMREYDVLYTLSKCRDAITDRAEPSRRSASRPCPAWWTGWPSAAWSSAAPTPPTGAASACRSRRLAGPCSARSGASTPAAWPGP